MENHETKITRGYFDIQTETDVPIKKIPFIEAESGVPGPVVWITAGVHGDEVGGVAVVQELCKRFQQNPLRIGAVKTFPLLNPLGFEAGMRHIPELEEDLNRAFPGKRNGTPAEQIAEKIFSTVVDSKPSIVLDLHNDWKISIPYALVDPEPDTSLGREAFVKIHEVGKTVGLLTIQEQDEEKEISETTLSGALLRQGVPSATFELGESHIVNEEHVRDGVLAVWNVLAYFELVRPEQEPEMHFKIPASYQGKVFHYSDRPRSTVGGLARYTLQSGAEVKKGDPVAYIYDVFGTLKETLYAESRGIILGYSDRAVVSPGDSVVALGVF